MAAAFTEAAGSVPSSIHASWDHTLYHPQEVLQALAQQKSSRKKSKKKHVDTRVAATEAPVPRGSPVIPAKQLTRDTSIFDAVPGVMSDFRKVCSCHTLVGLTLTRSANEGSRKPLLQIVRALECTAQLSESRHRILFRALLLAGNGGVW